MKYNKKISRRILIFCVISLLICVSISLNVSSTEPIYQIQKDTSDSKMKTLFMKADCQKIILYRPVVSICHIGPVWFTTEHAYLAFIIDEEFILRLDGKSQTVDVPAMVIPYKFLGLGPLFWIQTVTDPCNGNVTLIGWCEDVVIHPFNNSY